jgi:hypothetical protein
MMLHTDVIIRIGELMEALKAVKTYKIWFKPNSDDKTPPTYQVFLSASEQSFYSATVVALNLDSPLATDSNDGFWNRCDKRSLDNLRTRVDAEIKKLNGEKEIQYYDERWLEQRR